MYEASYGTIRPAHPFNAQDDVQVLRKAMKGRGTDDKAIIQVIANRSNEQRQEIKSMYKTMFGKDLIKSLHAELSGDVQDLVMALFTPTIYYDAWSLLNATSGMGTREDILIEILCSRTNAEIQTICQVYRESFGKDLESDIKADTSGHFKRLLLSLVQGNRAELNKHQRKQLRKHGEKVVIDPDVVHQEALALYKAGEKKWGTDESAFLRVFAVNNECQLRAIFNEYEKISGGNILSAIEKETSGNLKKGLKALVLVVNNRYEFFEERLHGAMKGLGTNDATLIRIMVSRSEIDLGNIRDLYAKKHKKTLVDKIKSETSGSYKHLLVAILGES